MTRVSLGLILTLATAVLGTVSAGAQSNAVADDFATKANAICAKAISDSKTAGRIYTFEKPLATFKATATRGPRWVAIDGATLKALAALRPTSAADPFGDWKTMLSKHRQATAELVKAIASARAGAKQAWVDHFTRSSTLGGGFGLRAWGLHLGTCKNWTP
jgi:hypothetical protein